MNTVEFPRLGIEFPINNVAFKVFEIEIFWYGIIIAFAFLLAVLLALKDSKKHNINQDNLIDVILWLTPAAIIGARLYYVIFSWDEFKGNLLDILNTRKGGLAIYGGVIAALITVFIFARVKKINAFELLDFGIVYVPLGQAIGRWGNFINQEAYGVNTDLPWGMTGNIIRHQLKQNADELAKIGITIDPSQPVHPTFLYESLWNVGVFLVLLWARKNKKVDSEVLLLYGILYGLGRAWIEGLRTDSLMAGNLRISQVLSILVVIFFSIILYIKRKKYILSREEETSQIGLSEYGKVLKAMQDAETTYSDEHSFVQDNAKDKKNSDDNRDNKDNKDDRYNGEKSTDILEEKNDNYKNENLDDNNHKENNTNTIDTGNIAADTDDNRE